MPQSITSASDRRSARRPSRALCSLFACVIPSLTIGCAAVAPAPETGGSAPPGITTAVEPGLGHHVVVLTAPTPGFQPSLTRTMAAVHRTNVFITVREPNPTLMHAQRLTEHRVFTGVRTSQAISVYVRLVPFDAKPDDETAYALVGEAAPASP
ncbi:MAG: hypothetical protein DYG92_01425 [Leptolyngbya sp. PLA1]|nr:hypothetical protein [Leptolyngbya sp. PLA1]